MKYVILKIIKTQNSSLPNGFFLRFYLFLDRRERMEKERERNINVWLLLMLPLTGDLAHSPGMCPDWESSQRPFGSQEGAQSTEPRQPGLFLMILYILLL